MTPYPPEMFDAKVQAVFDHIAYGDDGSSVYRLEEAAGGTTSRAAAAVLTEPDIDAITESVVERIRVDAQFASIVALTVRLG
jgi:hypothetical protein